MCHSSALAARPNLAHPKTLERHFRVRRGAGAFGHWRCALSYRPYYSTLSLGFVLGRSEQTCTLFQIRNEPLPASNSRKAPHRLHVHLIRMLPCSSRVNISSKRIASSGMTRTRYCSSRLSATPRSGVLLQFEHQHIPQRRRPFGSAAALRGDCSALRSAQQS
jgi:hypothetical protein